MTSRTSASRSPRRIWRWVVAVAALFVIAAWFWGAQGGRGALMPGAYVIPLDADSRAGSGWMTSKLGGVRMFPSGKTLTIPAGSRVRIVFADGRVEDVTGPAKLKLNPATTGDEPLASFLGVPLATLANVTPLGANAPIGDVRIVSPVDVTRFTNPVIAWIARPNTDYEVALIDPADPLAPPRLLGKTRPPLQLEQLQSTQKRRLQPDRLYEVYVREVDSALMKGMARVLIAKDATEADLATSPADLLREAVDAMEKRPTRTGDAWLALSRLPAEWSESELVVRLRLRVSADLGLMDEFARAQEAAWRIAKR